MRFIKISFSLVFIFGIAYWGIKSQAPIIQAADYEKYLDPIFLTEAITLQDQQLDFWQNKLNTSPDNSIYQKKMASLYATRFKLTGKVDYLHESDSLYRYVHQKLPKDVGVLQALAVNSISKHAFQDAEHYIQKALAIGEKKFASTLLMTDVQMERGKFELADEYLNDIASQQHFDYHIRAVKRYDQKGDLDTAVETMERALSLAKKSNNPSLINWSLSNLGDMYGHQGRIQKSYATYLEALSYKPTDFHSLKGIAWVAYSHEKDIAVAKRILYFLKSVHPIPDYDLLLAEIAAFEGNDNFEQQHIQAFIKKAEQASYGNMYKSYLGPLHAEDPLNSKKAMQIAEAEVEERPHPMSYSLKAWVNYLQGDQEKAFSIMYNYVVGKTEEPDALYKAGIIYQANGLQREGKALLSAAYDAAYELGPVTADLIRDKLRKN